MRPRLSRVGTKRHTGVAPPVHDGGRDAERSLGPNGLATRLAWHGRCSFSRSNIHSLPWDLPTVALSTAPLEALS